MERVFFIQSFVEAFETRGWQFLFVKTNSLASGTYFTISQIIFLVKAIFRVVEDF